MDELAYLNSLAKEVIRSYDQRLARLLAWCWDINKAIAACEGDQQKINLQAAASASILMMEALFMLNTGQTAQPMCDMTPFNRGDITLPKYFFSLNSEEKKVEITVKIVDFLGTVEVGGYSFPSITISINPSDTNETNAGE